MHIFFKCLNSVFCWQYVGLWSNIQPIAQSSQNVSTVIFNVLQSIGPNNQAVFACILWSIWKQRNDFIWRSETSLWVAVCERGLTLLASWQNAQDSRNRTVVQVQETVNHKWRKPAEGCYKCNIDAGLGVCIRDDQGSFVLAKTE